MRLVTWNPFREMQDLHWVAHRLFDEMSPGHRCVRRVGHPPLDVLEDDDNFHVTLNSPGVNKDDIQLSVLGDSLTIKGKKKAPAIDKENRQIRCECRYGSFHRTVELPKSVQADAIKADYKDGILTITLPKAETVKPKKISVNVAE